MAGCTFSCDAMPTLMAAPLLRVSLPSVLSQDLPALLQLRHCQHFHIICEWERVCIFKYHCGSLQTCQLVHLGLPNYFPMDQLFLWVFWLQTCVSFEWSPLNLICSIIFVISVHTFAQQIFLKNAHITLWGQSLDNREREVLNECYFYRVQLSSFPTLSRKGITFTI